MKNLESLRLAAGYTQAKLAELMGVDQTAVAKWEKGGLPRADKLPKLAELLGCTIDELLSDHPHHNASRVQ